MALPTNTGAFIHNGVNCTPNTIQTAQGVPYDNTSSGLSATNVQSAIDEVNSNTINTLKVELGSGAGSGSVFTFPTGGSTNGSWLVFWGGAYVGVVTIFSTTLAITKLAGSTAITATATISDNIITITMSSVPWANLRYVKLFA